MRSTLRALRVAALAGGLLVAAAGAASAQTAQAQTVQAETGSGSFGVLGPVGLAAVALGIVGMTLGVLRQRRKARAAEVAAPEHEAPGAVTALAEAVLADADNTPTRPFLAQQPGS